MSQTRLPRHHSQLELLACDVVAVGDPVDIAAGPVAPAA